MAKMALRYILLCVASVLLRCTTTNSFQILGKNDSPSFIRAICQVHIDNSRNTIGAIKSSGNHLLGASNTFDEENGGEVSLKDVGIVLLAGGTGSRMKANMPKQFLTLGGKPVLHHSLSLFLETLTNRDPTDGGPVAVVLVMDPIYQKEPEYQDFLERYPGKFAFAIPGDERQGSVENGLAKLVEIAPKTCKYVAVHDSARPLVTPQEIYDVVSDAKRYGAAVLGVPCKATIKESDDGVLVQRTIPRSRLWEVHTPQVILVDTLRRGFAKVREKNWEVTDDVSIVENMGEPVKLTLGEYTNLKITTPEDMEVAEAILADRSGK